MLFYTNLLYFQNLTEIRYLATAEYRSFEFQIWTQLSNGTFALKDYITITPVYPSAENIFTPPTATKISRGDICGVWVEQSYPIPTVKLENEVCSLSDTYISMVSQSNQAVAAPTFQNFCCGIITYRNLPVFNLQHTNYHSCK